MRDTQPPVLIRTLCPDPHLEAAGEPGRRLRFSKQLAALIYVAARPGARTSRDELLGLLWGGSDPDDARTALRQVLYQLRQALGPGLLSGDEVLVLDRERCVLDVELFRGHLAAGELTAALALYESDFLATVGLSGGREFEQWAEGLRQQLAAERRQALRSVVAQARDAVAWKQAVPYARQLVEADPHDLHGRLALVELLALAGDPMQAHAEADDVRRLSAEFDAGSPSGSLELAISRALAASRPPERRRGNGFPRHPEMVGRATEFRAVIDRWRSAGEGRGGAVLITGEAGIGKTRLLQELERRLKQDAGLVVRTGCYAVERTEALGPFLEVLRDLHGAPGLGGAAPSCIGILAALVPQVADRFAGVVRPRPLPVADEAVTAALVDAFAAIADDRPLALLIEDVHWAAPEAVALGHRLARRAATTRLLLVMTARDFGGPVETGHALRALTQTPFMPELPLRPLDRLELEQLLGSIADLPPEASVADLVGRLHARTDGIPLYVLEVLKSLYDDGHLAVRDHKWHLGQALIDAGRELPVPASSSGILQHRLSALGAPVQLVLASLAILGKATAPAQLAAVSGLQESEVTTALGALERRRIVGRIGADPVIAHDELAQAAVALLPAESRRQVHRRAADLAEAAAASGDQSAWTSTAIHAAAAGEVDRAMVATCRAAAAVESRLGPESGRRAASRLIGALERTCAPAISGGLARLLDGEWSARRWLAETDGSASRARRLGIAAAAALLVATSAATVLATRPREVTPPLGGGQLVASWGNGDSVVAFRLDSAFSAVSVPLATLPAHSRLGVPGELQVPDQEVVLRPCDLDAIDYPVICRYTPDGRRTLLMDAGADAEPVGVLPDGNWIAIAGYYEAGRDGEFRRALVLIDSAGTPIRDVVRGAASYAMAELDRSRTRYVAMRDSAGTMRAVVGEIAKHAERTIPWCGQAASVGLAGDGLRVACIRHRHGGYDLALGGLDAPTPVSVLSLGAEGSGALAWSPDGRYLALALPGPEAGIYLVRSDQAGTLHRIASTARPPTRLHWTRPDMMPGIVRLELDPVLSLLPGDSTGLSVRGVRTDDSTADVTALARFTSLDPGIVAADAAGRLRAYAPGTGRVEAALGLQAETAMVTVGSVTKPAMLAESFDVGGLGTSWHPFGDPMPRVIDRQGRGGTRAFHSNGDNRRSSGVAWRRPADLRRGLTIEYWMRVPVTRPRWQAGGVVLRRAAPDSFALRPWDAWPIVMSASFPNPHGGDQWLVTLDGDGSSVTATVPHVMRRGNWHRHRFIIYPWGEARWYVDGRQLTAPATLDATSPGPVTLALEGQSHLTSVLVDDVRVWSGVVPEGVR